MSAIAWIVLGSLVAMLARTMVNHSLVLAFVLFLAGSSWASPASAADARRLDQPALTIARSEAPTGTETDRQTGETDRRGRTRAPLSRVLG
ncbi:MAG TPA: hypothetical protein VGQ14_05335 [Candidatus Eisenbacteria bacterium]|nr:hypothetical protein [Candidatus Eisenbacteria bacterium]